MLLKEEKETKNMLFLTQEESGSLQLLGKKQQKSQEDEEKINSSSKTNVHGIIFKKNNSEKTVKKITCKCKNSQCLKLYCECFSKLAFCDPAICRCEGCANTKENEQSREALIKLYRAKNPRAFKKRGNVGNKPLNPYKENDINNQSNENAGLISIAALDSINLTLNKIEKGCTCKKSSCQKRYCECFQNGAACSSLCKCLDCKNNKIEVKSPHSTRSSTDSNNNINNDNNDIHKSPLNLAETQVIEANLTQELIVKRELLDSSHFYSHFKRISILPDMIIIRDYELNEESILI